MNIDRRLFLRGDLAARRPPIRPPWSLEEHAFQQSCERCDDCVKACPEGIVVASRNGYPQVDFSRGGCSFCGDCLNACAGRALRGDAGDVAGAWSWRASIEAGCLSARGIVCRACGDVCDRRAIRFRLETGGVARPMLDGLSCNGCGACVSVCPVDQVRMVRTAEAR